MAFFNIKDIKFKPRPIPDTPEYTPPVVPQPETPEDGSTPFIPIPSHDGNITIKLYNTSSENNMLNKVLTNEISYNGVFKTDTDSINPVIELETNDNITTHNYAYISIFNRYYFIKNIELCTGHIYKLYLTVDVLMSHKEGIKNLVCIVDRVQDKSKAYPNLYNENYVNDMGNRTELKQFPNIVFTDIPKLVLVVNGAYSEESENNNSLGILDGDYNGGIV